MDFEGKIFEFREIEAQNKGEKVNKTICFKGSGALNQRQESIVHDCNYFCCKQYGYVNLLNQQPDKTQRQQ